MSGAVIQSAPEVRAPQRLGPSRFALVARCPLQAVWASDRDAVDALPRSPVARVGTAAHAVLEAAAKGEFAEATVEEFDAQWQKAVGDVEEEMSASWLDQHLVPLEGSDRLYKVRRFQVEEAALALAAARQSSAAEDGGTAQAPGPKTGCELWVETADKRVGGFIDLVYAAGGDLVVRDYKTGVVTDLDEGTGELAIKGAYQEQLKIYAALYQATHGQWPTRLEVVTPAGDVFEIACDPKECAELLAASDSALDDLADLIGAAESQLDAQRALAKPGPEACRGCSFRPYCVQYLEAAPGTGEGGWPLDVWGALSEAVDAGDGTVAVTVAVAGGGEVRVRGLENNSSRHPALEDLTTGCTIGVFGLSRREGAESFETRHATTLYAIAGLDHLAAIGLA